MSKRTVWHYTYHSNIEAILRSRTLLPPYLTPQYYTRNTGATIGDKNGARQDAKMLLFSQREDWEPASYRGVQTAIGPVNLFKIEDYEAWDITVYRIGVSTKHLKPYPVLRRLVGYPDGMHAAQLQINREIGANHYDWWGTTKPITADKWEDVQRYEPTTKSWDSIMTRKKMSASEFVDQPTVMERA